MNKIDTYGRWFQEFADRNENSLGIVGFYKNQDELVTRLYPHTRYDAVSILLDYLTEQGVRDFREHVPGAILRTVPGLISRIKAFIIYVKNIRKMPRARRMPLSSNTWPEHPVKIDKTRLAWRVFQKSDTQKIILNARKVNANLNSFCLEKLVSKLDKLWVEKENNITVGIPVSLHQSLDPKSFPRNRFSFIDININETHSANEINEVIQKKIAGHGHYAIWIGSHLPRILGRWFYGYFLSIARFIQFRNILYSNVGVWSSDSDAAAFIIPPVLHYHPFSAGVITWGEKLAITIQIHPHLQINGNTIENIIHSWSLDMLESEQVTYWASSATTADPNFRYFGG